VFTIFMVCNLLAAAIGLVILRPMRQRHFAAARALEAQSTAPGLSAT
jgi:hypothetical protein